jgi:hypothetical protein
MACGEIFFAFRTSRVTVPWIPGRFGVVCQSMIIKIDR